MQTFIIWIASVICLMIHIPQVYGATPFNSDKDEDPMEADDAVGGPTSKRRVILRARRRQQTGGQLPLPSRQQGSRSVGRKRPARLQPSPLGKRKRERALDSDSEPDSESDSDSDEEQGVCKTSGDKFEDDESFGATCALKRTLSYALGYMMETEKESGEKNNVLTVFCGPSVYSIADGYIQEITIAGVDRDVMIQDPLKRFNRKAFKATCSDVFKGLQKKILGKDEVVEEGDMSMCSEIMKRVCGEYESVARPYLQPTANVNLGPIPEEIFMDTD
ncbi:hypothetical protein FOZ63_003957 [Perkinsus olseni]|uniref:Uncharacterized protein n=1 Tax=Perkinsus olseni TaxID=32597 RepID=A0A7J6TFU8_PEROL|nr:hypothetical protein FOZ63_003957 [Perkinsus olseni]KAF4692116.1 hypothetical protein FOZ60_014064 [Perkinsus olseni]KAF4743240.1 hypothetical protein FOZ62_018760 [Perkinsus olseni]